MIDRLANRITHHPKTVILIATLLLIPSILCYAATGVNYDVLSYLPEELESVQGLEILDNTFHMASSSIVIVEDMNAKDVLKVKDKIEQIKGVKSVTWVDSVADITIPAGILPEFLTDIFYSDDGTATLMLVEHTGESASEETLNAIDEMNRVLGRQCFISGLSAITADTRELCNSDAILYIAIAVVLALIALSLTLHSWVLPFVLLISLGYAVVYNMGTNLVFGSISFLTQTIAAILQLGVTMDYSVFLVDRFEEEKMRHEDIRDAMAAAVTGTFSSVLSSSLTTVFGFLALCFMSFSLGLDIGLVMAKGVLFGILTVVCVLPAFMLLLNRQIRKYSHRRLIPSFARLNEFTLRHRKAIIITFCVLIVPAYLAKSNVTMFYNMAKTMPQDMNSIAALNKLGDEFGMSQTHFALVRDDLSAGEVTRMIDEIELVDGVKSVISPESFVGAAIPYSMLPQDILDICRRGGYSLMMITSSLSAGTLQASKQVTELKSILKSYDGSSYLTGDGVLTHDLIEVTNKDFTVTGIISVVSIFILIAICFKSLSVPILLVASIELSIFINEAVPFFMGTEVPFISPTVIGCIQLGATVDYAILLTNRFREELRQGSDKKTAMLTAANESHKSVFQSALVFFSATAGVYFTCDIVMVQSICAMLARGSVISAFVIIFMLTPMLYVTEGIIDKTSIGWRIPKAFKPISNTQGNDDDEN